VHRDETVYILSCIYYAALELSLSKIGRVFNSGNSQAVRLPKEFRLNVSEVDISREGNALVLRPRMNPATRWAALHAAIARKSGSDLSPDTRGQPGEQERPDLDTAFE